MKQIRKKLSKTGKHLKPPSLSPETPCCPAPTPPDTSKRTYVTVAHHSALYTLYLQQHLRACETEKHEPMTGGFPRKDFDTGVSALESPFHGDSIGSICVTIPSFRCYFQQAPFSSFSSRSNGKFNLRAMSMPSQCQVSTKTLFAQQCLGLVWGQVGKSCENKKNVKKREKTVKKEPEIIYFPVFKTRK